MTIAKTSYVERFLIVTNPDGTLKGAAAYDLETVKDGDEVLSVRELPAREILPADLATLFPGNAALIATISEHTRLTTEAKAAADADKAAAIAALQEQHAAANEAHAAAIVTLQEQHSASMAAASEAHAAAIAALREQLSGAPTPMPAGSVTLAQARVAIRRAGLFEAVDTAVRAAGGEALDAWEYSNTVSRASALVASLSVALGLTGEQVDDLFIAAAAIEF